MHVLWFSAVVRLGLIVSLAGSLVSALVLPVAAQAVMRNGEQRLVEENNEDIHRLNRSLATQSPQPNEFEQPATSVEEWLAQIEALLVQITNVRVEATETGLQVVLETANGSLAVPETRTIDNALIADIPNAMIAQAFSQANLIEGIALVAVTSLPGDRVQVAITGTDAPPVAEVTTDAQGLVLAVTLGDTGEVTEEDTIEIVVTGEPDEGYNPSSASTATRTDTPLRDIPQTINVVPQEVLRDQNVTTFNEALRNVPGVTPIQPSRRENSFFIIRGFDSTVLRNGLREAGALESQLTPDIERIEVLLGPASAVYGGDSLGGTINIVTKQPLRDPFYAVDATIGNYDFYQGAIDLSGSLNDSRTILYRLNTSYRNNGSFVDFFEQEAFTIAPVMSFALGDRTRFTLEGEYTDRNQVYTEGLPAVGTVLPNPNGRIPRNRFAGDPDGIATTRQGRVGYRLEHQLNDNWSLQNAFQVRLTRLMSTDRIRINTGLDADNRTFRGLFVDNDVNSSDIYDLSVNLTGRVSTGSIDHQLVFGTDLGRLDRNFDLSVAPAPPIDVFNPVYGQPATGPYTRTAYNSTRTDTLGIYLQDQITLAENLKLLLGSRFDLFEQTNQNFLGDTRTSQSGNAFSPRAGIVYQLIQPISLYASYSSSFTPAIGTAFDGSLFQPERGTQYEIGVKADLNDQLSATLALFNLTRSNVLTEDNRPGIPPGFSIQTGEQRSRGIELNIAGRILPGWNILAGYAYTDAQITKDNTLPVGNRLNTVPENAFNLWTTYEIQSGNLQGLGFGLGLFFVGERQADLENSFQFPSYLRTDAAVFYRRNQFRVGLNFTNLFDIEYFEASGTAARNRVNYGTPFTVQGTISWEF